MEHRNKTEEEGKNIEQNSEQNIELARRKSVVASSNNNANACLKNENTDSLTCSTYNSQTSGKY